MSKPEPGGHVVRVEADCGLQLFECRLEILLLGRIEGRQRGVRARRFRILTHAIDEFLPCEIRLLLTRVDARVRAMSCRDIALPDLGSLLQRFLFATARKRWSVDVVLEQGETCCQMVGIE